MSRGSFAVFAITVGLLCAAAPVLAHHAFAAEYDSNKPVTFTGTVTKVALTNPHIYVYVDAKDASGKITNYLVEGGTPNGLRKQGWGKDSIKVGETISISGYAAKNGSNHVNGTSWTFADGRKFVRGDNGVPEAGGGTQARH
jgi:hypothetical protein